MVEPRYSSTWPVPPDTPILPMMARIRSLAVTPGRQLALDVDGEGLRLALQQALGREHVADLGGADAEGEGAEGTVRAGVAVAAHDGHAGLRGAEFRADDVHDAAPRVAHAEQLDAEFGGVALELAHLLGGGVHLDRHIAEHLFGAGGRRVIHGGERAIGAAHRQPEATSAR